MKKDAFDNHLKQLFQQEKPPLEEPKDGHQLRFMQKLNAQQKPVKKRVLWKPITVAASFLAIIALSFPLFNAQSNEADLASISPEFAQTQQFFTSTINRELANLKREKAPETTILIEDALKQMETLENDYKKLKVDLVKSGHDDRVIHAMISNFQSRIDLLQHVLEQIEHLKTLKLNTDESII